ncbi:MAG: polysaccharide pyruvyl transferase CsaB [Armatimonadetes bacterium]|nr:polysaccharide pyruvyl transferase CsaB [Armatimonadota bacterium]
MPRIVISGYYGLGNTGDEAVLEGMVGSLRKEDPGVELSVLTADEDNARRLGLRPVPRKQYGAVARALLASDLLLSGGGGLIQDSTGVGSVVYYLGIAAMARLLGRPVMFYSQGFGPVRTGLGRLLVKLLANRVHLITVRDEESAEGFRKAGVTRPPLRVTADPALALEPAPPARIKDILKEEDLMEHVGRLEGPAGRHSETGPLVAVTVRSWPGFGVDAVAEGLVRFADSEKARYLVMPFHPELDLAPSEKLCRELGGHARLLQRERSPAEVAGILRCCDMVLGMRLHSLILAAAGGVPFVGLSYDPKVERFCRRAGAVPLNIEYLSSNEVAEALRHLLAGRAQARRQLRARIESMVEMARRTARAALCLSVGEAVPEALRILDEPEGIESR